MCGLTQEKNIKKWYDSPLYFARKKVGMELSPLYAKIKDFKARTDVLRGYL
jgi:hypothetical protein